MHTSGLGGKDVAIDEPVPRDNFASPARDGLAVHGGVPDEGMELAVLAAGVYSAWKVLQECPVEGPSDEGAIQGPWVDAHNYRPEANLQHLPSELGGVPAPQREHAVLAGPPEALLPVGPDVLQEQVRECDVVDSDQ